MKLLIVLQIGLQEFVEVKFVWILLANEIKRVLLHENRNQTQNFQQVATHVVAKKLAVRPWMSL